MRFKDGVCVTGIAPELVLALMAAERVYDQRHHSLVVTSLLDGKHSATSLHYAGCAADLRIWGMSPNEVAEIVSEIREALTGDYDVVAETDHIHLEWQPRMPV